MNNLNELLPGAEVAGQTSPAKVLGTGTLKIPDPDPIAVPKAGKVRHPGWVRVSKAEQIFFAKRLAILLKAGIPLLESLRMLEAQARSRATKTVLRILTRDVEQGQYLATSLGQFRRTYGDLAISLIRIGERSGTLADNLQYLADTLKKKQELKRKVVSALVYPIVIVCATFGIITLLMVYVFPKILPIFASLKFELPWSTRLLIVISNVLIHYGLWILLGFAVAVIGFWLLMLLVKPVRFGMQRTVLAIPLFGRLSQNYQVANFCRTLGLLMKCGVVIVEAAKITAETTPNLVYRQRCEQMTERLTKGDKISAHLLEHGQLFPVDVAQLVSVGEATGNLSDSLAYLGEIYEAEVDDQTKNLTTLIEPVLMIVMGLLVGFIAISIITPIYGITQNLHP